MATFKDKLDAAFGTKKSGVLDNMGKPQKSPSYDVKTKPETPEEEATETPDMQATEENDMLSCLQRISKVKTLQEAQALAQECISAHSQMDEGDQVESGMTA
jgi:hypothetical protein